MLFDIKHHKFIIIILFFIISNGCTFQEASKNHGIVFLENRSKKLTINKSNKNDVIKYKDYADVSDIILFDSKGYHKSESFDHNLLNGVSKNLDKMIAGSVTWTIK